jgi:hypothetical protein
MPKGLKRVWRRIDRLLIADAGERSQGRKA